MPLPSTRWWNYAHTNLKFTLRKTTATHQQARMRIFGTAMHQQFEVVKKIIILDISAIFLCQVCGCVMHNPLDCYTIFRTEVDYKDAPKIYYLMIGGRNRISKDFQLDEDISTQINKRHKKIFFFNSFSQCSATRCTLWFIGLYLPASRLHCSWNNNDSNDNLIQPSLLLLILEQKFWQHVPIFQWYLPPRSS